MVTLLKNAGGIVPPGSDGSEWQTTYYRVAGTGENAPTGASVPVISCADLHKLLVTTFDKPAVGYTPEITELPGLTWQVSADGEPATSVAAAKTCASGASLTRDRDSVSRSKESLIPGGIFMAEEVRDLLFQLPADLPKAHNLQDLLNTEKFPRGTWYGVTHIKNLGKTTSKVCPRSHHYGNAKNMAMAMVAGTHQLQLCSCARSNVSSFCVSSESV